MTAHDVRGNCKKAFDAGEALGIPRVIEPADMDMLTVPDKLAVMTYLYQLRAHFTGNSIVLFIPEIDYLKCIRNDIVKNIICTFLSVYLLRPIPFTIFLSVVYLNVITDIFVWQFMFFFSYVNLKYIVKHLLHMLRLYYFAVLFYIFICIY